MNPQTTTCSVPREVVQAAPHALVQLMAYGAETNLSYPARPADPKIPWNIEWTVKVRYKSQTGGLLGMAMPGAMRPTPVRFAPCPCLYSRTPPLARRMPRQTRSSAAISRTITSSIERLAPPVARRSASSRA